MVYGREVRGQVLKFEASGALLRATLVMRDDRTDSWWSIMTSSAIGGPLQGASLRELPVGRKVQWRDWVAEHPDTLVLSVDGTEHVVVSGYEGYFRDDGTFRGQAVTDRRLSAKAPVFAFRHEGRPFAVPHSVAEGGRVLRLDRRHRLVVWRAAGAGIHASTDVWRIPSGAAQGDVGELLAALRAGRIAGAEPVPGFDTFWYTWVAVQENSRILR